MHIKFLQRHRNVQRPLNLTLLRDSNPGTSVLYVGGRDFNSATPPGKVLVI
jgi:hypothetical protein